MSKILFVFGKVFVIQELDEEDFKGKKNDDERNSGIEDVDESDPD